MKDTLHGILHTTVCTIYYETTVGTTYQLTPTLTLTLTLTLNPNPNPNLLLHPMSYVVLEVEVLHTKLS